MNSEPAPVVIHDRWIRIIAIPVLGFFIPMLFFGKTLAIGLKPYIAEWVIAMLYAVIYYEGNRFFFIQVHQRFPRLTQTRQRIAWLALCSITYIVLIIKFVGPYIDRFFGKDTQDPTVTNYMSGLVPTSIFLVVYECYYYFSQLRAALHEADQLKQENIQSQLETLKNQVNPHFLFNSLNTLAAIIPDDADLAVEFVQKLSKVYRYILEIRDSQTVSLRDELVALTAYNFLLQMRFGTNLDIRVSIPDSRMDSRVVPLALQMLVENAVKHNIISTQKPLTIDVFVEKDNVIVSNNLQRKNQSTDSTGLGLPNIQNRYQLLANQPVNVIVTTQTFSVSLPLLPAPVYERLTH